MPAAILALALALRIPTFGDPALHTDEEFYFLVGQRLLDGQLPYVDIWDRKPLGLFLIYAVIAAVSRSVVAYQIAGTLSAAMTAYLITRIVATRWPAQLMAAMLYLGLLIPLGGFGGQAPVFYNLLIVAAFLLTVRAIPELDSGEIPHGVYSAVFLCGLALTIKQTVIAEAVFLGMFSLALTRKANPRALPARFLAFALIGVFPTAAIGAIYAILGHWAEFYQAMITSNLAKGGYPLETKLTFAKGIAGPLWFPALLAVAGLLVVSNSRIRLLLAGWLFVSIAALLLVPNFYWHYGLPLLPPICCGCAYFFERRQWMIAVGLIFVAYSLMRTSVFDVEMHQSSQRNMEDLAQKIDGHSPRSTLLVFDGPVYLYAMSSARPLSPLVLPWHLKEPTEMGVSGRNTNWEIARILANRPGAVTFQHDRWKAGRDNPIARQMVLQYVESRCRPIVRKTVFESQIPQQIMLYGDCQ